MPNNIYNEVIVIDLEATCWDTAEEKVVNTSEIIEIGICVLNVLTGEISKPAGLIIKPRQSKISPFCEQLTTITQEMVDAGMSFEDALAILKADYGVGNRMMAAYGNYDKTMLTRQCTNYAVKPMFGPTYLNISAMATLKLKANKRLGLKSALSGFGLTFDGTPHRGVDDAVQAARVLWEIIR
jgi:inhibitor of KinA sporulation pathway (predicted exonuclease)